MDNQINVEKMLGSSIITGHVAGNIYSVNNSPDSSIEQQKNIREVAWEITDLIKNLETSLSSSDETVKKVRIAASVIEHINSDPSCTQRVLSAIKAGGIQALEQALNHPAASFIIGALEDWKKQKVKQLPQSAS